MQNILDMYHYWYGNGQSDAGGPTCNSILRLKGSHSNDGRRHLWKLHKQIVSLKGFLTMNELEKWIYWWSIFWKIFFLSRFDNRNKMRYYLFEVIIVNQTLHICVSWCKYDLLTSIPHFIDIFTWLAHQSKLCHTLK